MASEILEHLQKFANLDLPNQKKMGPAVTVGRLSNPFVICSRAHCVAAWRPSYSRRLLQSSRPSYSRRPGEASEAEENFVDVSKLWLIQSPEADAEQSPKADAEEKIYDEKIKDIEGTKNFSDEAAMKTEAPGAAQKALKKQSLLSGVGSKVKHQLAKVKKAIVGKPGRTWTWWRTGMGAGPREDERRAGGGRAAVHAKASSRAPLPSASTAVALPSPLTSRAWRQQPDNRPSYSRRPGVPLEQPGQRRRPPSRAQQTTTRTRTVAGVGGRGGARRGAGRGGRGGGEGGGAAGGVRHLPGGREEVTRDAAVRATSASQGRREGKLNASRVIW